MKTVFLLRHAKSSWDQPGLEDFHRPLAPRGRKAASRMGRYMAEEGILPHRVLCSGAVRAVQTWELWSRSLEKEVPVEFRDDIYHASSDSLLRLIRALPEDLGSVLLLGHNPTFEHLALRLAGSGRAEDLERMRGKYPTGALAILDLPTERWRGLEEGTGVLRGFVRPKDLP